jgi:hypothetical protein
MKDVLCPRRALFPFSLVVIGFAISFVVAFAQNTSNTMADGDHLHHRHYTELAKVPTKARNRHNPLEGDSDAVAAGGKLFERHCAECHGHTAEGGRRAPSLRAREVQLATPGTLFWLLTNGVVRRGMPVWSKLPEPERWQIVTFLKSLPSDAQTFPQATGRGTSQ